MHDRADLQRERLQYIKDALVDMWSSKTPAEAYDILARPDVMVTNMSDKDAQLPRISRWMIV